MNNIKSRWLFVAVTTPLLTLTAVNMGKFAKTIVKEFGQDIYSLGRIDAHRVDGEILSRALSVRRHQEFLAKHLQADEFLRVKDVIETVQPEILQPLEWQIAQRTLRDTMEDEQEAALRASRKNKPKLNVKKRLDAILENLKLFLKHMDSKEVGA